MNQQQQRSIQAIQTNTTTIKQIAEQERQRGISQKRKRAIESLYASVVLHAHKLGLDVPRLSVFYKPDEYLANCDAILKQIEQKDGTEARHSCC